jgi:hypothetical protein
MRYPRREVIAVIDEVEAGTPRAAVARKLGVSCATIRRWHSAYLHRQRNRSNISLWLRYDNIERIPSIEAQTMEWINLMVENDRFHSGDELPRNVWLKWKGFEVYVRWTTWREVRGKKVLALDLANIRIPKRFRGRSWFRIYVELLRKISPTDGIVVEEVSDTLNPWMKGALNSWGFKELFTDTYWIESAGSLNSL